MAERLSRELRIFHELAGVVADAPYDVDAILERICTEFRLGFAFDRAMVVRYRTEDHTVHAVVLQNLDWPGDEWLLTARFPFLEQALRTKQAVVVRDARAESAMPSTIIERFGVRSVVAVPLVLRDSCLGFLVGDRTRESLDLASDELRLLTALGVVAAVFIDKADAYAELERRHSELQRLDQAKDDFVSIASHELRTPIAVIHGIASTLQARAASLADEQLVELRRTLIEQTVRLRGLAEQLLDLSRLDAGAVSIRPERFRPRERFDSLFPRLAATRSHDIRVRVDPALELDTDPVAFERVVLNLVENALRYGSPPVEVRAEANGETRVVVEDRGNGVDPAFVPQLFDRFTRSEESRAAGSQGAGLGLAIAASFARALGGELTYEPAEPRGARFTLVLPRTARRHRGSPAPAGARRRS